MIIRIISGLRVLVSTKKLLRKSFMYFRLTNREDPNSVRDLIITMKVSKRAALVTFLSVET